jgi:hypothetical protein
MFISIIFYLFNRLITELPILAALEIYVVYRRLHWCPFPLRCGPPPSAGLCHRSYLVGVLGRNSLLPNSSGTHIGGGGGWTSTASTAEDEAGKVMNVMPLWTHYRSS